jgi:hypothetical protein
MAMISGPASVSSGLFPARSTTNPAPIRLAARFASPQMILAFAGMICAVLLIEFFAVIWSFSPSRPANPEAPPPARVRPLSVWTGAVAREDRALSPSGGIQKAPAP